MTDQTFDGLPPGFQPNGAAPREGIDEVERELSIRLPDEYRDLLRRVNGGEGPIGAQSYLILWRAEELVEHNRGYRPDARYAPDLVCIGTDGGNEVFAIRAGDGHYVAAPLIGVSPEAVKDCGATFTDFVRSFP